MNFLSRIFILILAAGLLSGCGASRYKEPDLTLLKPASLVQKGEALVILSGTQLLITPFSKQELGLDTSWMIDPKKLDVEGMMITSPRNTRKQPRIRKVKPGVYKLFSFSYTASNVKATSTAGMRGIYLAEFTLKPDEVLYVGDLNVHTETKFFSGLQKKFALSVENHEKLARAHLAKKAPSLAPKMKTRLLKINPLFTVLKKLDKLKEKS